MRQFLAFVMLLFFSGCISHRPYYDFYYTEPPAPIKTERVKIIFEDEDMAFTDFIPVNELFVILNHCNPSLNTVRTLLTEKAGWAGVDAVINIKVIDNEFCSYIFEGLGIRLRENLKEAKYYKRRELVYKLDGGKKELSGIVWYNPGGGKDSIAERASGFIDLYEKDLFRYSDFNLRFNQQGWRGFYNENLGPEYNRKMIRSRRKYRMQHLLDMRVTFQYDANARLKGARVFSETGLIYNIKYHFDENKNLVNRRFFYLNTPIREERYAYDELGRVRLQIIYRIDSKKEMEPWYLIEPFYYTEEGLDDFINSWHKQDEPESLIDENLGYSN